MKLIHRRIPVRTAYITEQGVQVDPTRVVECWWVAHDDGHVHPLLPLIVRARGPRHSPEGATS